MLVDVLRRNKNWLPPIVYLSVNDHRQDGFDLEQLHKTPTERGSYESLRLVSDQLSKLP